MTSFEYIENNSIYYTLYFFLFVEVYQPEQSPHSRQDQQDFSSFITTLI